jgi:hypothetical protein
MIEHERDAYAATVADARAYMRGDYTDPMPGTLASEIDSYARGAQAVAITWTAAIVAVCLMFAAALWPTSAQAQAIDRIKPAQGTLQVPLAGLYVDQTGPQRYCVVEFGRIGPFDTHTFLFCAAGFNNAGHHIVTGDVRVGQETLLYRLAGDGLMFPAVVNSVTITEAFPFQIKVKFGSPGAQSPTYTLIRQ